MTYYTMMLAEFKRIALWVQRRRSQAKASKRKPTSWPKEVTD